MVLIRWGGCEVGSSPKVNVVVPFPPLVTGGKYTFEPLPVIVHVPTLTAVTVAVPDPPL